MKEYNKPVCSVLRINIESALLTGSIQGGEIGGTTDYFDAKSQFLIDFDEDYDLE